MGDTAVTERDAAGSRRRLRLPRRPKILPGGRAASRPEAGPVSPTSYRTLSRKLPTSLTALGGALALLGGLGAWARATELAPEALAPEEVRVAMGYTEPVGVWIAVAGGAAIVASLVWLTRRLLPKLVPVALSATTIGLVATRLPEIDATARGWAVEARQGSVEFVSFHAGFGWGAWFMLAAAVTLALGIIAGVLRELDLRRGIPE